MYDKCDAGGVPACVRVPACVQIRVPTCVQIRVLACVQIRVPACVHIHLKTIKQPVLLDINVFNKL